VYLDLPNGQRAAFTFEPILEQYGALEYYRPAWTAEAGVDFTLETSFAALTLVGGEFYQLGTGLAYNPASGLFRGYAFTLRAADGSEYRYDHLQQLRESFTPGQGTLIWSDSGIIAANGERIGFQWDRQGRLVALIGPDGNRVLYSYNEAGCLVRVNDLASGRRVWYGYEGHDIVSSVSSQGQPGQTIEYADGEVQAVDPLDVTLGPVRHLLGQAQAGMLTAGRTRRYAFVLGANEFATALQGQVTIGLEVVGSGGLSPALPVLAGLPAGYTFLSAQRGVALYTLQAPGTYIIEVSGLTPTDAGNFTLEVYLAGDANTDGGVDGADKAR